MQIIIIFLVIFYVLKFDDNYLKFKKYENNRTKILQIAEQKVYKLPNKKSTNYRKILKTHIFDDKI